ncbi:hypothetical protein DOTSEDRAFT_160161 [Dothistroma septosporum NZE10]|uniref:NAD(P)-binding domain-containing protein n=1 Tax=Dothistroma septosporum (strain NZE10 / CBS 128990) TaxID=675120 RepID=M2YL74_DOTSN|nr:hypothetical protein DOTSEDRAFT_160161 [Dothistroma septosporum NZE10]
MSNTHQPKTLAFFGATGDCAGYCLASSLNASYSCTALVRTPQKLIDSLKKKGVSQTAIDFHLTIIQGDAKNLLKVKTALQHKSQIVDTIVSGIGGTPALQWSLREPVTLTDRTICQDAGATIVKAARELTSTSAGAQRPLFINVSTTGIPAPGSPWDVPFLLTFLYRWFLHVPHQDKAELEKLLRAKVRSEGSGIRGFVNVKPSLLMNGEGRGVGAVRVGTEKRPAVGYMVQRRDVGEFMFERLIKGEVKSEWVGQSLTVTY